ncbi:acetoacetate decarboxylase [Streptomyces ruber]|uniref:Acetoacetate decarboxylase n=2 Tax=Streptomyces TaxID=1883 RepID=A0A918ETA6_9ACTN|nr:acetoacetate decarboxylase family protein [Streptomyces ruber]GGQ59439.1 acetoacetate decarboxylase [Streptomyces ruber]
MTPHGPYPPSPWHLTGDMLVSLWRVPVDELPRWPLPPGVRPWVLRRRCTLVTFWVDYRPGGVLAYREFLVGLAVRHRRGLAATAVAVWVDDERSLAGGRALWGIPKELGVLRVHSDADGMRSELVPSGAAPVRAGHLDRLRLPFPLVARTRLVQRLPDGTVGRIPVRIGGRAAVGRTVMSADPAADLSFLGRRRPVVSLTVRDFRGVVGER